MKLASTVEEVFSAIDTLNASLESHPELVRRLGQAHAYYAKEDGAGGHRFGFSKFIGYKGLTAAIYLRDYKQLNGRNTEFLLGKWFEELPHGSAGYRTLHDELAAWMAGFGQKPREGKQQKVRLMVLKPEFATRTPEGDDRRLLDLLIAVANLLPHGQRRQLRASL